MVYVHMHTTRVLNQRESKYKFMNHSDVRTLGIFTGHNGYSVLPDESKNFSSWSFEEYGMLSWFAPFCSLVIIHLFSFFP